MTDKKAPPREFWLLKNEHCEILRSVGIEECIHKEDFVMSVIEFSAFLAMKERVEKLRAIIEKRCICSSCVEHDALAEDDKGKNKLDF